MAMQTSKQRMLAIKIRDLQQERKALQLELTLEQLCLGVKTIEGTAVFNLKGKRTHYYTTVHQPSTADPKRIANIQARLNDIYRELFTLQQEEQKLNKSDILRPVLRWGKFLSDIELHWI